MPKTLESYLDRYPEGPKSCVYCLHFKTKIPVVRGELKFSKMKPASCKEGLLLRGRGEEGHGELYEPNYPIHKIFWKRIKDGVLRHEWRYANLCSSFTEMRDD